MKNETIGIIGGAGPMAGALLVKKIVLSYQKECGCMRDCDYPKILLLSIPFSEMLVSTSVNASTITEELTDGLNILKKNGADILAIACNTLHGFLEGPVDKLISMPKETQKYLSENHYLNTLVLATSTAIKKQVYASVNNSFLKEKDQKVLDQVINCILRGSFSKKESCLLESLILTHKTSIDSVILGCTELSVLHDAYALQLGEIAMIDPLDIMAKRLSYLKLDEQEQLTDTFY